MTNFTIKYLTNSEHPQNLIVFLHGYDNSYDEMLPAYHELLKKIPNLMIAAPFGQFVSQKDITKHRWYQISGFDTEGKRQKAETSIEEISDIYDKAATVLEENAIKLNADINDIQKMYGFDDANTFIAGFSQGAMLALWTALTRHHKLGGCFSLSGFSAASQFLETKICSKPFVYLMHGEKDNQVQFKCMKYTQEWLQKHDIPMLSQSFENLEHKISSEELDLMANFVH